MQLPLPHPFKQLQGTLPDGPKGLVVKIDLLETHASKHFHLVKNIIDGTDLKP